MDEAAEGFSWIGSSWGYDAFIHVADHLGAIDMYRFGAVCATFRSWVFGAGGCSVIALHEAREGCAPMIAYKRVGRGFIGSVVLDVDVRTGIWNRIGGTELIAAKHSMGKLSRVLGSVTSAAWYHAAPLYNSHTHMPATHYPRVLWRINMESPDHLWWSFVVTSEYRSRATTPRLFICRITVPCEWNTRMDELD